MQHSKNHPDTYKHLLMMRLGYLYVPPSHLLTVCKDGVFQGYLTAGYHRPNKWQCSYPQQINVSTRRCDTTIDKIRASDGGEFSAKVVVKYQFDPRNIEWEAVQAKLSVVDSHTITKMVKDALENELREAFAEYPAHTIQHGSMRNTLQRRCKHLLMAAITHLGFHIGDVVITKILAPQAVEQRANEAVSRMIAADYLRDVPYDALFQLLIAQMPEILQSSGLSLNMQGEDQLTAHLKKLIERLAQADRYAQSLHQTGAHPNTMTDTRNGHSTLH